MRLCSVPVAIARFVLLVAVYSAMVFSASPVAAQWPIKTFQVVNVEPAGHLDTNRNLDDVAAAIARLLRTAGADPDFPGIFETVPLDPATKADIESLLSQSAGIMERWGFPPPALQPVVDVGGQPAYRVYLVAGREGEAGSYHPSPCNSVWGEESVILLDADDILRGGALNPTGTQTVPHELFHAVQWATPFFRDCGQSPVGTWATEGQARAVGVALAQILRGATIGRERSVGVRRYSDRLPVPTYEDMDGIEGDKAYATSSFWRYLAERASAEAAGSGLSANFNPPDFSYLARLLQRPATHDCYGEGAACRGEIEWLDAGLRAEFGERLRDIYPAFVNAYVGYRDGRWAALGGDPETFLHFSFDDLCDLGGREVRIRPHRDSLQVTDVLYRFDPVSAQCWEIDLSGFEEETVEVAVTVRGPRTAAQLGQLTAVVPEDASGEAHVDTATVVQPSDLPIATWYYELPNADSSLVLLTSVAPAPAATRPLPALNVTFTAIRSAADAAFEGVPASGIEETLPVRLKTVTGFVAADPNRNGECAIRITGFTSGAPRRRDAVELNLNLPRALGEGSYGVRASNEPVFLPPEDAVGWVTGGFQIGPNNPLSGGEGKYYWLYSGSVEITSVVGRRVKGEATVVGWRDRRNPEFKPLSVAFSFFSNTAFPLRIGERMALPCLIQSSPENASGPPPESLPVPDSESGEGDGG